MDLTKLLLGSSQSTQTCESVTTNDALAITIAIIIVGIMIWYIFKYDGSKKTISEIKKMLRNDIDMAYSEIVGDEDLYTLFEIPKVT